VTKKSPDKPVERSQERSLEKSLEDKIDQLIALCAQLNRENRALKEENLNYQQERRDLIAKNELARARVEATLQRLRSMEAAS
jgi:cell division protein ZapB